MEKFDGFLYHITRYRRFAVGEKFVFGQEYNFFARKIFEADYTIENRDVNLLFLQKSCRNFSPDEEKIAKKYYLWYNII